MQKQRRIVPYVVVCLKFLIAIALGIGICIFLIDKGLMRIQCPVKIDTSVPV